MPRRWIKKFSCACRGLWMGSGLGTGAHKQNSFLVHLPVAAAVLILAGVLRVAAWEWCVLILSIALVLAAELFNTSIEVLVRHLHPEQHADIGRALDVSAGAVLVTAFGAAAVGVLVLGGALLR